MGTIDIAEWPLPSGGRVTFATQICDENLIHIWLYTARNKPMGTSGECTEGKVYSWWSRGPAPTVEAVNLYKATEGNREDRGSV